MSVQPTFRTFAEAKSRFAADAARLADFGIVFDGAREYVSDDLKRDYTLAMDALPATTLTPNAGLPAFLTMYVDPKVIEVLFMPTKAAEIAGETRKGTWLDQTMMFTIVEHTGEVSSYGDYNNNGRAGVNTNFPQRQSYLFQTIKQYGELELERAGLAKINYAAQCDMAAATVMARFHNQASFFGVAGIANYGLVNDPSLSAPIMPGVKTAGNGNVWLYNNAPNATANEIFNDIEALFIKLVTQTGGLVDRQTKMTLAMSPASEAALTTTNSYAVNVSDLLTKNFPNLKVVSAVQYGAQGAGNPLGITAGNFMQLIANELDGQQTVETAFNEKMREHPMFVDLSSYRQKVTGGTWGTVWYLPLAVTSMVGL